MVTCTPIKTDLFAHDLLSSLGYPILTYVYLSHSQKFAYKNFGCQQTCILYIHTHTCTHICRKYQIQLVYHVRNNYTCSIPNAPYNRYPYNSAHQVHLNTLNAYSFFNIDILRLRTCAESSFYCDCLVP